MTSHAIRHPREGGGPSPDRQVYPRVPVMDSRLRGNDEVRDKLAHYPLRCPVLDTGLGCFSYGAEKSQAPHQVRGDDVCGGDLKHDLSTPLRLCVSQK